MAANNDDDLTLLEQVVTQAGEIALKYFGSDNEVWMKPGDSPVSQADLAVNEFLQIELLKARPGYGWLSEENEDTSQRLSQKKVFVVDPIDGTRGFIDGSNHWCISVAIVEDGRPVSAILECPALKETYIAQSGGGTRLNGNIINAPQKSIAETISGSRKINKLVSKNLKSQFTPANFIPSLAYRIAMVANGAVDIALARPGAHDWDLAAADLILTNALGGLFDLEGNLLRYNTEDIRRGALIACPTSLRQSTLELANSSLILH